MSSLIRTEIANLKFFVVMLVLINSTSCLECADYSSCTSCTFPKQLKCTWCSISNKCIYSTSEGCTHNLTIPNGRSQYCHKILSDETIYIPDGAKKNITFKCYVQNVVEKLECKFHINGEERKVDAIVKHHNNSMTVECGEVQFTYNNSAPTQSVQFSVNMRNSSIKLENEGNVTIVIYKCDEMTSENIKTKYNCDGDKSESRLKPNDKNDEKKIETQLIDMFPSQINILIVALGTMLIIVTILLIAQIFAYFSIRKVEEKLEKYKLPQEFH